jgi:hypothetical protein
MKLPIAVRPLANREPGRLHLSLQGLDAEPGWAERLERDLAALPGLHRICASLPNCSLWLRFDPKRWDAVGIVQAIGRVLERPCRLETPEWLSLRQMWVGERRWLPGERLWACRRHEKGWLVEGDPLVMALCLGVLSHIGPEPDGMSLAFERAAFAACLPVHDWNQRFRYRGFLTQAEVQICLRRRGCETFLLARGEPLRVLDRCGFHQDLQGCHPLDARGRATLAHRAQTLGGSAVALAYRPLLFGQRVPDAAGDWILAALAVVD